jgi:mono/diheme cytochrome c family protein
MLAMKRKNLQRGAMRRIWLLAATAVLATAGAVAWWQAGKPSANGMFSTDPKVIAEGRQVYEAHCASCHGPDLKGQPNWRSRGANGRLPAPPHDPSGHTWHHPSQQLFEIVKHGVQAFAPSGYESDMPGYDNLLSDSAIWAVLAYIRSTWPAEVRQKHEEIDRSVKTLREP